jgi:hypothetical protein
MCIPVGGLMRRGLFAAGLFVCVLRAANGQSAPDARSRARTGPLQHELVNVVNQGVALYQAGDYPGCYRLFHGAVLTLKPLLADRPDLQRVIDAGLAEAARQPRTWQQAWALRRVLDRVRAGLGQQADIPSVTKTPEPVPPPAGGSEAAAAVATCGPIDGVLLQRAKPDAAWQFLDPKQSIRAEVLLVALPGAKILSGNGNVQLGMIADIGHRGPLPVYESAVRLHQNAKVDLDVSVERGIATFTNLKKEGTASVRVRFAGQTWDLTLREPGTKAGMEIYGRQPPGAPEFVQVGAHVQVKDPPTIAVYFGVARGSVALRAGDQEIVLDAPPGPAKLHWDSALKRIEVMHLDKLPESLQPTTDEERKHYEDICTRVRTLRDGDLDTVLEKALESDDPMTHNGAVVVLGALDKLPRLLEVLGTSKYADARDKSIVVLRNWVGRGPGQTEKLYDYLTNERKLKPPQAKTALHLLFGFTEKEYRDPDTYEVLIGSLNHSKLAVRELARWHLVRLAPEGKKIGYDAAAAPEQRAQAYQQWRVLIPAGQVPPHLRAQAGNKE